MHVPFLSSISHFFSDPFANNILAGFYRSNEAGCFSFFRTCGHHLNIIVQRWWCLCQVELIVSKAVNMVTNIGGKCCHNLLVQVNLFLIQLLEDFTDHMNVVKDQDVGDQMVEFDALALFNSPIFGNDSFTPKERPLSIAAMRASAVPSFP